VTGSQQQEQYAKGIGKTHVEGPLGHPDTFKGSSKGSHPVGPAKAKPKPPPPPVPDASEPDPPHPPQPAKSKGDGKASFETGAAPGQRNAQSAEVKKRWLRHPFTHGKGPLTIEVRADRTKHQPQNVCLKCTPHDVLLLLHAAEGFAYVRHLDSTRQPGWLPLDSLSAMPAYDFLVKVPIQPDGIVGLICEPRELGPNLEGLVVVSISEGSVLDGWNKRCEKTFPRDQLFPGDHIIAVRGDPGGERQTGSSMLQVLNQYLDSLEMHVVRHAAASLFGAGEPLAQQLPTAAAPAREPNPQRLFREIDRFQ